MGIDCGGASAGKEKEGNNWFNGKTVRMGKWAIGGHWFLEPCSVYI